MYNISGSREVKNEKTLNLKLQFVHDERSPGKELVWSVEKRAS